MAITVGVHIGHDCSVAIFQETTLLYAEEEERQRRVKNYFGHPTESLAAGLRHAGLRSEDVEILAVGWDLEKLVSSRERMAVTADILGNSSWARRKVERTLGIREGLQVLRDCFSRARLVTVDHHSAHAASVAPFWDSAETLTGPALVLDAVGEDESATAYLSAVDPSSAIIRWPIEASLGYFYQRWAEILGFRGAQASGYLMSLSACGDFAQYFGTLWSNLVGRSPEGLAWIRPEAFRPEAGYGSRAERCFPAGLLDRLGLSRSGCSLQRLADVAAAVQRILEEIVLGLAARLATTSQSKSVTVAGGVFLNCSLVRRLREAGLFARIYTGPAAKDSGVAVGAAVAAMCCRRPQPVVPTSKRGPHLGTPVDSDKLVTFLEAAKMGMFSSPYPLAQALKHDLDSGYLAAVADNQLEFGPRALGARSILSHANDPRMAQRVNSVKRRFPFQPVAASMSSSAAEDLFGVHQREPFMTSTYEARPGAEEFCAAALHADRTCRVHVADEVTPSLLSDTLALMEKDGEKAVVLNTSFNRRGMPLPATQLDALEEYCSLEVEVLYCPPLRIELTREEKMLLKADLTARERNIG